MSAPKTCDQGVISEKKPVVRVLLVEDNALIRYAVSSMLKEWGFDVLTAEDGFGAVALAASEQPALVLMDMGLPALDGAAAARLLKGTPGTARIPILALTAHAPDGVWDKGCAAGFDDCEPKPINFDRLLGKIQALLKKNGRLPEKKGTS